jgi:hypothetical protein
MPFDAICLGNNFEGLFVWVFVFNGTTNVLLRCLS